IPTENTLGGDPEARVQIYTDYCMACHRFNGAGERFFRSAPLTTLPDWYLASSLRKYREGIRGGDVNEDRDAWKMHQITQILSDEAIDDIAAHLAHLAEKYPPGERKRR
ncbi:MAG: cytochrome c, partial [Verrucomicrobiota bacterium]